MVQIHIPRAPYLILESASLREALEYLNRTKGIPLTVVDDALELQGMFSQVDFLAHLQSKSSIQLNILEEPIKPFINQFPHIASLNDKIDTVSEILLKGRCRSLPLIDSSRIVKRIATNEKPFVQIGNCCIGSGRKPLIIAEIGVNHNGDLEEAKRLIRSAAQQGIQAVKFQHRSQTTYDYSKFDTYDLGTQYIIKQIKLNSLTLDTLGECIEFARSLSLIVIITPFDERALEDIQRFQPDAIKIASCDLTNNFLLKQVAQLNLPIILSTGMSYEREILMASEYLASVYAPHIFLHCNSTYPSPIEDINLKYISRLSTITGVPSGFSCHLPSQSLLCAAIACGASVLEIHITSDQEQPGTDHSSSFHVSTLSQTLACINDVYHSLGSNLPRIPSQGELSNRLSLGKSLAYNSDLPAGHILSAPDFTAVSPGSGVPLEQIQAYLGSKLQVNVKAYTLVDSQDLLTNQSSKPEKISTDEYSKLRESGYQVGIPVRYHDFNKLVGNRNLDFVEFHMSSDDIYLKASDYVDSDLSTHLTLLVHAIEQYSDGFILDFASAHQNIVTRSREEIDKLVCHIDAELRPFFNTSPVSIILNIGGFSTTGFASKSEVDEMFETAVLNLKQIVSLYPEYTFLPQTMPPHPWHQGGRSFHNLLTSKDAIQRFLSRTSFDICLDVSHTALSSYLFGEDLYETIRLIGPRIAHIHLSDAKHPGGEGLAIGSGQINFRKVHAAFMAARDITRKITLLPEVWQGHLNNGQPFFTSLNRYQRIIP